MKIGVIDIGSNSVRTMCAARSGGAILYSEKQVYTTRLAEGLAATGRLSDARMAQSLDVIERFAADMRGEGAIVYAYATSAVRDAENRDAFVRRVAAITGGDVDVLTGEQEARYAFIGADCGRGGMLDIGGGSTQLVTADAAVSVPIGCVRAKDICGGHTALADIRSMLRPILSGAFPTDGFSGVPAWSGVGGTITTLAAYALGLPAYDRRAVTGAAISIETFEAALQRLDDIPLAARAEMPLLRRRCDVILHGGAILLYLMDALDIVQLTVSDTDGMEGYAAHVLGG